LLALIVYIIAFIFIFLLEVFKLLYWQELRNRTFTLYILILILKYKFFQVSNLFYFSLILEILVILQVLDCGISTNMKLSADQIILFNRTIKFSNINLDFTVLIFIIKIVPDSIYLSALFANGRIELNYPFSIFQFKSLWIINNFGEVLGFQIWRMSINYF